MRHGGLREICETGIVPGLSGSMAHKDPTCADLAIPRALRDLERTKSAKQIAREAGHSINTLRETWKI